ncbi:hypothetical protein RGQ13_06990 [Thalassotalea psychrophila]|uniref:KfrA N-terminal DNA-binding domain-containing protein n=1 Tax=Thalassotalea psychrophila TaxID=3065647 RepID=A0ABY9TYS2_9GAMM|nr:hypothetical protein RGQ13_06990 [Colwelliaceae bacterium SQ149]
MSSDHEIYQIAAQLAAENKTPTVALIKARLSQSLPLARVIKGLQTWQNNPKIAETSKPEIKIQKNSNEKPFTLTDVELLIKQAIAPLQAEIELLKAKLSE